MPNNPSDLFKPKKKFTILDMVKNNIPDATYVASKNEQERKSIVQEYLKSYEKTSEMDQLKNTGKVQGLSTGVTDDVNMTDMIGEMLSDPTSPLMKAMKFGALPLFGGLRTWNTAGRKGIAPILRKTAEDVISNVKHSPLIYSDGYSLISKHSPLGKMQVARFNNIPWMDWDIPDALHSSHQVEGIGEVIDQLMRYTTNNKTLADIYLTPGGYHAVDVGPIRQEAKQFYKDGFFKQGTGIGYNVDKGYSNIARSRNSYDIRTGPKMVRNPDEEFIGSYIGSIGDNTLRDKFKTNMVENLYELPIEANLSEAIKKGRTNSNNLRDVLADKALSPLLSEPIPNNIKLQFLRTILDGK